MIKLFVIAGARPNFVKVAPIVKELDSVEGVVAKLVHTGQHYDENMSGAFFKDLDIRRPDIYLGVGSGSHAVQTAEIMKRFEGVLLHEQPDIIVVVGDVNSTFACALVASKIAYDSDGRRPLIAHVEAGLRSFDRSMPEEINRILTDHISDLLFITEESAKINLVKEGVDKSKIFFVGNVMIDALLKNREKAEKSDILSRLGLNRLCDCDDDHGHNHGKKNVEYGVVTLHRPANVDKKDNFEGIVDALSEIAKDLTIIFPVHPRTSKSLREFEFLKNIAFIENASSQQIVMNVVNCIPPLGYLDFLHLLSRAELVLTDSGGIQEETTMLGIPCITIRENTERPVTITCGTNRLVGTKKTDITNATLDTRRKGRKRYDIPPLWDGMAAKRITSILLSEAKISSSK